MMRPACKACSQHGHAGLGAGALACLTPQMDRLGPTSCMISTGPPLARSTVIACHPAGCGHPPASVPQSAPDRLMIGMGACSGNAHCSPRIITGSGAGSGGVSIVAYLILCLQTTPAQRACMRLGDVVGGCGWGVGRRRQGTWHKCEWLLRTSKMASTHRCSSTSEVITAPSSAPVSLCDDELDGISKKGRPMCSLYHRTNHSCRACTRAPGGQVSNTLSCGDARTHAQQWAEAMERHVRCGVTLLCDLPSSPPAHAHPAAHRHRGVKSGRPNCTDHCCKQSAASMWGCTTSSHLEYVGARCDPELWISQHLDSDQPKLRRT